MPGGLTAREGIIIMETLFETGRLRSVDITEINPELGNESDLKKTVDSAIHLLKASCGTQRSGNLPLNAYELPKPQ